ncbi:MAG: pyridoxine 5'-phosphate synthase [Proteobacteria bacterium]|nr:pyridoxine 5'-phosphate synthase [Pseudomonadota bacterium]MCH8081721.1 pyridoxine 5'-phosphate synthase [Pseudomonadota bacterium]MCH8322097.1 pyridoxine 5'-phosphate synthase [Pseudomonadota bacterium]
MTRHLRLGINIDHVATIRNARGGYHPDPVRAAIMAAQAGADGITAHLREDRRHISDHDIKRLAKEVPLPLNLEIAATGEMLDIALAHVPHACCIVPEKREEVTTEGGLDVKGGRAHLHAYIGALREKGIRVSLFIDPDPAQVKAAAEIGADVIELHTGRYCETSGKARDEELGALQKAARLGATLGLEIHAGHGLSFETVGPVAAIPEVVELNIGHFLVGEAIFCGFEASIRRMRQLMDQASAETPENQDLKTA